MKKQMLAALVTLSFLETFCLAAIPHSHLEVREFEGQRILIEVAPDKQENWNLRVTEQGEFKGFLDPDLEHEMYRTYLNWKSAPPRVVKFKENYVKKYPAEIDSFPTQELGKAETHGEATTQTRQTTSEPPKPVEYKRPPTPQLSISCVQEFDRPAPERPEESSTHYVCRAGETTKGQPLMLPVYYTVYHPDEGANGAIVAGCQAGYSENVFKNLKFNCAVPDDGEAYAVFGINDPKFEKQFASNVFSKKELDDRFSKSQKLLHSMGMTDAELAMTDTGIGFVKKLTDVEKYKARYHSKFGAGSRTSGIGASSDFTKKLRAGNSAPIAKLSPVNLHQCKVVEQNFRPGKRSAANPHGAKMESGLARQCDDLSGTGSDKYSVTTYEGELSPARDRQGATLGLKVNGRELLLNTNDYCVTSPTGPKEERCGFGDRPPGHHIEFFGAKDSGKPKVMVIYTDARQPPGKSGIDRIDRDRLRTYKTKGVFRQNGDFDYYKGALVVKIEDGKLCPVAGLRLTPKRSTLLRLTNGRDYVSQNDDYERFSNRAGAQQRTALQVDYEKKAYDELELLAAKAEGMSCDSVSKDEIKAQLDRENLR